MPDTSEVFPDTSTSLITLRLNPKCLHYLYSGHLMRVLLIGYSVLLLVGYSVF